MVSVKRFCHEGISDFFFFCHECSFVLKNKEKKKENGKGSCIRQTATLCQAGIFIKSGNYLARIIREKFYFVCANRDRP